jgi:hypothetical protein
VQEIIVTISPDAEVKVETQGFKGSACKDATKALESALGSTSTDTNTREYYENAQRLQHRS